MSESLSLVELYKKMLMIRYFEEGVLKLFEQGKLFGTTHAYIGQEANAVGVITNLRENDTVVSNHRCHGHYITHKQNPYSLLCEMMGKKAGLCAGRGGSQHICDDKFFSNGVQGGIMPLAAGLAFSEKFHKTNDIIAVFIGDGTLGEGVLYETINISSKWDLPILIIVENNRYAQSTKIELALAGKIKDRFTAFDIDTQEIDTFNVIEISNVSIDLIKKVRKSKKPHCLIINTYRFASHSKSDDGRDQNEVEKWKVNDPLKIAEKKLGPEIIKAIGIDVKDLISDAIKKAVSADSAL
jgi:TPP-dependent pyruvate/acetoin dehydrogenase alpha subunit